MSAPASTAKPSEDTQAAARGSGLAGLVSRFWVALIRRSAAWPVRRRARIASMVGTLAWLVVARRRRIADANLRACFPSMTARDRRAIARRLFCRVARGALDYGILWHAPREDIHGFVRADGLEHLHNPDNYPLIMLAPHFVGLDAGGSRIATEMKAVTIYARQSNAVFDHWLRMGRARFNEPVLIPRRGADLRGVLRAMREGLPFYYLPDMDNGRANSIFVPFLGVPAATIPMVSRLARAIEAKIVMAVTEQTEEGYILHIEPPWQGFPGASIEEDTERMNREIERWVLRMPDQYLWTHRRFKTRPEGAKSIYS